MERQQIITEALEKLSLLPDQRLKEVAEYIDFLVKRNEERFLLEEIKEMVSRSKSFHFLKEEEELYNDSDLIQKYE